MTEQTDSFLVMDHQGIKHTIVELTQYYEHLTMKDYLEDKAGRKIVGLKYFETAEGQSVFTQDNLVFDIFGDGGHVVQTARQL